MAQHLDDLPLDGTWSARVPKTVEEWLERWGQAKETKSLPALDKSESLIVHVAMGAGDGAHPWLKNKLMNYMKRGLKK